jgi:hypothetical protein
MAEPVTALKCPKCDYIDVDPKKMQEHEDQHVMNEIARKAKFMVEEEAKMLRKAINELLAREHVPNILADLLVLPLAANTKAIEAVVTQGRSSSKVNYVHAEMTRYSPKMIHITVRGQCNISDKENMAWLLQLGRISMRDSFGEFEIENHVPMIDCPKIMETLLSLDDQVQEEIRQLREMNTKIDENPQVVPLAAKIEELRVKIDALYHEKSEVTSEHSEMCQSIRKTLEPSIARADITTLRLIGLSDTSDYNSHDGMVYRDLVKEYRAREAEETTKKQGDN